MAPHPRVLLSTKKARSVSPMARPSTRAPRPRRKDWSRHTLPIVACVTGLIGARGSSRGDTWTITTGWERTDPEWRGDWFQTAGPAKLEVDYEPAAAPPEQCRPGDPLNCGLRAFGCDFELTQAASAERDNVEARLTAPCEMRSSPFDDPWRPTLTSFRFRTHVTNYDPPDAGPCVPFP
jgi:hypothetical protein